MARLAAALVALAAAVLIGVAVVSAQDQGRPGRGCRPSQRPCPTVTATGVPTAAPTAIPTDTPQPTATETPTPEPASTPTEEPTPVPTETRTPTLEPTPTDTPSPTPTATPTATATATATPDGPPTPHVAGPVLVGRYEVVNPSSIIVYNRIVYRPRQFVAGANLGHPTWSGDTVIDPKQFVGWDILPTWKRQRVWVNRDATVAAVWYGPVPSCAQSWAAGPTLPVTRGAQTKQMPTSITTVTDGMLDLCASSEHPPILLVGEIDGSASLGPGTGIAPNQTCPAGLWPAGAWAPQIDPTNWCYNRVDHGANPDTCYPGWNPGFGVAASAMGMSEPPPGNKVMVFDSVDGRTRWCFGVHLGSSGIARICNPFHTVNVTVLDLLTGEVLAEIRSMADFGGAIHNDTKAPIRPPQCPRQVEDALARGVPPGPSRQIPVVGGTPSYEPWKPWLGFARQVGFVGVAAFFTIDVKTWCSVADGCVLQPLGENSGTLLYFQGSDFGLSYPSGTALPTGSFCSDAMLRDVVACDAPGSVRQFVSPSLVGRTVRTGANRAEDVFGFGQRWVASTGTGLGVVPSVREGSIRPGDAN